MNEINNNNKIENKTNNEINETNNKINNKINYTIDNEINNNNTEINEIENNTEINEIENKTNNQINETNNKKNNQMDETNNKTENQINEIDNKKNNQMDEINNKTENQINEIDNKKNNQMDEINNKTENQINEIDNKTNNKTENQINEIDNKTENKINEIDNKTENKIDNQINKIENQINKTDNEMDETNGKIKKEISKTNDIIEKKMMDNINKTNNAIENKMDYGESDIIINNNIKVNNSSVLFYMIDYMSINFKKIMELRTIIITILIIGVVICGSIEHISIPIVVTKYESLYFILIASSFHGTINFGIILLMISLYLKKFSFPKNIFTILCCSIINGLMSICFIYSANPQRTPVIIQSIFLGLAIFPTVIFRKLLLRKTTNYNLWFIIPSTILLLVSIGIAIIPLILEWGTIKFNWIIGYLFAIMLLSLDNIMQEKYITDTKDESIQNKLTLAFYTSFFQVIVLLLFFWVEYVFGYTDQPVLSFLESVKSIFTSFENPIILELFIIDCLILYLFSIVLNAYSTNFNMILTNLTNQSVAIFFSIFPHLNNGLRAPIYITIPSLCFNIISVILWINGEKNENVYIEEKINYEHQLKEYKKILACNVEHNIVVIMDDYIFFI